MSTQWHGDSSVTWGVAVVARLREALSVDQVRGRLAGLTARYPHLADVTLSETTDLAAMASSPFGGEGVRVAVDGNVIAVAAHHHIVDGLGLVALLSDLTGTRIQSRARGLGDRPGRPFRRAAASRILEALFAPPDVVAASGRTRTGRDVFACTDVDRVVLTGPVVVAAAAAIRRWNGRPARVAVAIGASRRPGAGASPIDDSAYLRLRRADRLDAASVDQAVRTYPTEPAGRSLAATPAAATVTALLSRRLGSTLLVSHLGELDGDGLESVAFYPVTGGRSGVSLGAATVSGRTTLTLRARGGEHSQEELSDLLAAVRDQLR
jgi:hypothetical protein